MNYQEENANTIDRWIEEGWEWGVPISTETYANAVSGVWDMVLTPTKPVPKEWFGDLRGKKILGLASGGGQQMPLFSALGAECTVLDYSDAQLASEKLVAQREGYSIKIVKADMTQPLPFEDTSFDLIFHPVSNCYIESVLPVWKECYRILKPQGKMMAGLDNGFNYLFSSKDETKICHSLPFNPLVDPELMKELREEDSGVQFSHTLEEQIRGQLNAGFHLIDLYEDTNGEGFLHDNGVPTFWATLVEKPSL